MKTILLLILLTSICVDAKHITREIATATLKMCLQTAKVPQLYLAKFGRFEYPDEERVYNYLHCFWSDLGLWTDEKGFDETAIDEIAKDRWDATDLIRDCNQSSKNNPIPRRVYQTYICILNNPRGEFLKEDIKKILQN